jgi:hypothetical protein
MKSHIITRQQAQLWINHHVGYIALPAGCIWHYVSGLHYAHQRRYLWLVAGDDGLHGVYGASVKAQAERKAG